MASGATGGMASGTPESGRVRALQQEVEGVKTIMTQNVERILARGENLEQLHSKSQDLEATVRAGDVIAAGSPRWQRDSKMDTVSLRWTQGPQGGHRVPEVAVGPQVGPMAPEVAQGP
ncbi:PREDICTED: synaptobrevin-1-like [Charadrius vociferus]|uniref:synaptobrevin-1-like n=1 Tax=Charadrius vociferus TaxID=50402 RepID=UPI000521B8A2|nr:PREDICTED: synaptobrevin-1-like [Charadrius vociferus]